MEQKVNYEANAADNDDHPGSTPSEGEEAASEVTGAMEKDAVAAGSKKRAASLSILIVGPGKRKPSQRPHGDKDDVIEQEEKELVEWTKMG